MTQVLVTGASGFIGRQLVESLVARGDRVACLVRKSSNAAPLVEQGAELRYGDVCDPAGLSDAVREVDVVYHVAGITKAFDRADFCTVNETGVHNILSACAARTSPPNVLVVSSLAAAGPAPEGRLRTESDPPAPVSNYGFSKRAGELVAESFAGKVPITIVRPPVVLGPGDVSGLALFRSIKRIRSYFVLGRGRIVSAIHVADLVNGMIAAADRGERLPGADGGGRGYYFFAADEQPTFSQLGRMVARSVNRPYALAIRLPIPILWAAGGCGELCARVARRPFYMSLDRAREMSAGHWGCSAEKAKSQLGFAPAAPLAERIQETARWYREHGWL